MTVPRMGALRKSGGKGASYQSHVICALAGLPKIQLNAKIKDGRYTSEAGRTSS